MFKGEKSKWLLGVLVVVLFFGFSVGNGFGKITKEYDEYNECTMYNSDIYNVGPWNLIRIYLEKRDNKFVAKTIQFSLVEEDRHNFAERDLEMKIDGNVSEVTFFAKESEQPSSNSTLTSALYMLNDEIINKMYNADDITVTVYMDNVSNITWDVPDSVLSEWKKLIEKSGVIDASGNDEDTDDSDEETDGTDEDTNGSSDGGGGGCSMSPSATMDYSWLMLLAIPAILARRKLSSR